MTDIETRMVGLLTHLSSTEIDFLTDLGPLILSAAALDVARDTRSLARVFNVAHALVIRECSHLQDDLGLLDLDNREEKSGRLFFALSDAGQDLSAQAEAAAS